VEPLNYSLRNIVIPEASRRKYLAIIVCSNLRWADQVNYVMKTACKALLILKGNSDTKSLAYTSPVHPILEYGMASCDPQEGQIHSVTVGAKEIG
jgi:hypothetical protein